MLLSNLPEPSNNVVRNHGMLGCFKEDLGYGYVDDGPSAEFAIIMARRRAIDDAVTRTMRSFQEHILPNHVKRQLQQTPSPQQQVKRTTPPVPQEVRTPPPASPVANTTNNAAVKKPLVVAPPKKLS